MRLALWSLYIALLLPLPFLARGPASPNVSMTGLGIAIMSGGMLLHMVLSEQVRLDEEGMAVGHPGWVPSPLRRGWSLRWSEVEDFQARSTGQGGLVYYLISKDRRGFLLPMRVVGFTRMLGIIQLKTGINTQDVKPLAQPWMYAMLLVAAGLLAIIDLWVIWTARAGLGHL